MKADFLITTILTFFCLSVSSQEWIVPAENRTRLSPFAFTDETRKAGEQLFMNTCKTCHGTPGQGNVINLTPKPKDPASPEFQKNSDGEFFYKISEGRGPMPSFKNVLSPQQRWDVISYLRTFNPSYKQQVMEVIRSAAYPGAEIRIRLSFNGADTSIVLSAEAVRKNISEPVVNAGVQVFVRRTFGMLPLDEEKNTDASGLAHFRVPGDLPADTAGNLYVSASFTNEELFGAVSKDTVIQTGVKLYPVSLRDKRAFWNTVWKAPVWLLITYFTALIAVWGLIFYVIILVRDIYVAGKVLAEENTGAETEL